MPNCKLKNGKHIFLDNDYLISNNPFKQSIYFMHATQWWQCWSIAAIYWLNSVQQEIWTYSLVRYRPSGLDFKDKKLQLKNKITI